MKRWAIPIVAVAILTAACGGAASLSQSNQKAVPVGTVQLNGGANAGDTSDISSRPNPPVHKSGTVTVKPSVAPLVPNGAGLAPADSGLGPTFDRCGPGIVPGLNGATTAGSVRGSPKIMCAVE